MNDVVDSNKHRTATSNILKTKLSNKEKLSGMTDLQIVEGFSGQTSNIKNREKFDQILLELDRISEDEIKKQPVKLNKNIKKVLIDLKSESYVNGVITGNTETRCKLKLVSAKIYELFDKELIFSGGDFNNRDDLVKSSIKKTNQLGYSKIVIIGDTPLDINAAKKSSIKVIAVATGKYSMQELNLFQPDLTIKNFKTHYVSFMNYIKSI